MGGGSAGVKRKMAARGVDRARQPGQTTEANAKEPDAIRDDSHRAPRKLGLDPLAPSEFATGSYMKGTPHGRKM